MILFRHGDYRLVKWLAMPQSLNNESGRLSPDDFVSTSN